MSDRREKDDAPTLVAGIPLDYAGSGAPRQGGRVAASGICALILMVIQFPWMVITGMLAWADRGPTGTGPTPAGEYLYVAVASMPTVVAIVLVVHSRLGAGTGRRDICGMIATALIAVELVLVLRAFVQG